jgi:glutamate 5-kinase
LLRKRGLEVILVSSGAIASGLKKIGFSKRPQSVSQQQAVAAVGQSSLMITYEEAFGRHGHKVAQVLLTRDDLSHRRRYLNARNTLFTLLSWKIIPIINENDTVVVDEIKFGDNDNLSAMVTNLTESQLLVNLTDIDGLFDKDPRTHKDASIIRVVEKVDRRIARFASLIPGFLGKGGMASKIKAAQKIALGGTPTIIANGLKPLILKRIFSGKEEGTLFLPQEVSLCARKHWIVFTKSVKGELVVDRGAEQALLYNGKSLLPSGIREVRGRFSLGDSVLLMNERGKEIAVGMVNYHSGDIKKIVGAKTAEIESRLGFKHDDEVIHRDNLVLTNQMREGEGICQLRT